MIRIGVIGYKNHPERLLSILNQRDGCEVAVVYHPLKSLEMNNATNDFSDLFKCDAVVIASPNTTHSDYIHSLLKDFEGYVFCEKPPVTTMEELQKLENLSEKDKQRIFFNFNYRFSSISNILTDKQYLDCIGNIIHFGIVSTHGLAFKEGYAESWRADGNENLHAITETVAIHYIDLLMFHFGRHEKLFYVPDIKSGNGSAYDTASVNLTYAEKMTASIFVSYACPYIEDISVIGTNGVIRIHGTDVSIFSPRDTFDSNNFFTEPPLVRKINIMGDYEDSLNKSLNFFIGHVQTQEKLDLNLFKTSIDSNRIILEMKQGIK